MKLRTYLAEMDLKTSEFADLIEYGRDYVSRVMNGKIKPGKKMARRIAKATDGLVVLQPSEKLPGPPKKKANQQE